MILFTRIDSFLISRINSWTRIDLFTQKLLEIIYSQFLGVGIDPAPHVMLQIMKYCHHMKE